MKIKKINDHVNLNFEAYKKAIMGLKHRDQDHSLSKDEERRIHAMKNKAEGYVSRFGDKTMLKKELEINSDSHQFLLLNLGMAIDKKEALHKAINSSMLKKNSEILELRLKHEVSEKEIKNWLFEIDSYYLKERFTNPILSKDDRKPCLDLATSELIFIKSDVAFGNMLNKSTEELKGNINYLSKLLLEAKKAEEKGLDKDVVKSLVVESKNTEDFTHNANKKLDVEVEIDEPEVETFEESAAYQNFLNEERVEREMSAIIIKNLERDGKLPLIPTVEEDYLAPIDVAKPSTFKPVVKSTVNAPVSPVSPVTPVAAMPKPSNSESPKAIVKELSLDDVERILNSVDDSLNMGMPKKMPGIPNFNQSTKGIDLGLGESTTAVKGLTSGVEAKGLIIKKPTVDRIQAVLTNVQNFEGTNLGKIKTREVSKRFIFNVKKDDFLDTDKAQMNGFGKHLAYQETIRDPLNGRIISDKIWDHNGYERKRDEVKFKM